MGERVRFVVPGEPKGKGRPRFSTAGKYPKAVTPEETASYENLIKVLYMEGGFPKLEGAVRMEITAYFKVASSASKKRKAAMLIGEEKCMKKPDADNIVKCVADGLNGVAYDDDKQIVELEIKKLYGTTPQVIVELMEI